MLILDALLVFLFILRILSFEIDVKTGYKPDLGSLYRGFYWIRYTIECTLLIGSAHFIRAYLNNVNVL